MANERGPTAEELFGAGRPPRDTKERLLYAALNLFYAYGFHAVGLDRILQEVGVTKTTFYNHYESKDDLILAAVAKQDEWEQAAFARRLQEKAGFDPKKLLLAMFDVVDEWFNDPRYRGCLFLLASQEFPNPKDPIHKAAAKHYVASEASVRQMAEAAGVDDPDTFAQEWVVLLQGALTYRQVAGADGAARIARGLAEGLLERRLASR